MALNKKNRLKRKNDFEDVFKKGKAVKGSFLFVKFIKNKSNVPRFGFVVSAKIAKSAVERNKIRRILSEVAMKIIYGLDNYDFIVFATHKITVAPKESIEKDFGEVLKKIK